MDPAEIAELAQMVDSERAHGNDGHQSDPAPAEEAVASRALEADELDGADDQGRQRGESMDLDDRIGGEERSQRHRLSGRLEGLYVDVSNIPVVWTMSTSEAEIRRAYHHGDLRQALLAAAANLLRQKGASAVSLREVAKAAGVSHNAPYRHFPSRDALLAAVAAQGFADLRQRLVAAAESAPADERLQALGRAYVRFAVEQRPVFVLMFGGELDKSEHPALAEAASAAFHVLRLAVSAAGASASAPIETVRAWALAHGLAHLVAGGQLPLETAEQVFRRPGITAP